MAECAHENFVSNVSVFRLSPTDSDTDDPYRFAADLRVNCAECGAAFGFRAPMGLSPGEVTMSADGLELRVPLVSPAMRELVERTKDPW